MSNRIVLIGAGSTNFGLGVIADFFKSEPLNGAEIVLYDINSSKLQNTLKIALAYKEKSNRNFEVSATTSIKEALTGAKYCLISIEVGSRFDLWDQDWKIPMQYGFNQIYGENGGPGGLFHSLRIIPPILEICGAIERYCPNAFVFNFSNPMQRICHAVSVKFPDLKFVGLCHEIKSMQRQLPILMETGYDNIEYEAGGLNHFSILLNVKYKNNGKDGYPIIREKFEEFYSNLVNDHEGFISQPGAERGVFFEIFKHYGYLPITTDSHLGEYIPWAYSVADHQAILDFYENYKRKCLGFYNDTGAYEHFFDPQNHNRKEMVAAIIEHIELDSGYKINAVNLPNQNFINCIPDGIVVEIPAIVSKSGVHGCPLENYPAEFGSLLNLQTGVIQLTTQAAIQKSRKLAYLALLSEPVVDDAKSAERLLNTMISVQNDHLGYLI